MIGTVLTIALQRLWNNKQELVLIFIVPIIFFSIFALIFTRGIGGGVTGIKVAIVDDDASTLTLDAGNALREQTALEVKPDFTTTDEYWPLDRISRRVIQNHRVDIVVYFPKGMEAACKAGESSTVELVSEGSNPVSRQMVRAVLAQAVAQAQAKLKIQPSGPPVASSSPLPAASVNESVEAAELVGFTEVDLFASNKSNPKIAMYAAGIAVMFLLFSAVGAGGSLLEENEAGTLDRLLSSRLSITQLLAGKWVYITLLGCVQLTVMFVWAQLVFGVDLLGHIPGFLVMTFATAAATASLALCLAVVCRTRNQLNGVSVVVILTMSALGGSMIPRYIMSERMQQLGKMTFNAWALDGYKKVFWYDMPVNELGLELLVLGSIALYLAAAARILAIRWERG